MAENAAGAQESRTDTITIRVTRTEKEAIELVAKVRKPEGGVSGLLRDRPFAEVVEDGCQLLDRLAEMAPAEKVG